MMTSFWGRRHLGDVSMFLFFSQATLIRTSRARNLSCWGWHAKSPKGSEFLDIKSWVVQPYQWRNSWSLVFNFSHPTGLPQNPSSTAGISQYFLATGFRMVGEALQRFWLLMLFSRSCQFVSRRCDLLNSLVGCSTPNMSCGLLSLLMAQGHVHKSHWMSAMVSTSAHCCNTSQQLTTGFTLLENIVF